MSAGSEVILPVSFLILVICYLFFFSLAQGSSYYLLCFIDFSLYCCFQLHLFMLLFLLFPSLALGLFMLRWNRLFEILTCCTTSGTPLAYCFNCCRVWSHAAMSQRVQIPPLQVGKGQEQIFTQSLQREHSSADVLIETSDIQSRETTNLCCFKPLNCNLLQQQYRSKICIKFY